MSGANCSKNLYSLFKGSNGPLVPEFLELVPNATVVPRAGEINAYDNADFVAALEATGKKQVILAGILTDVCKFFANPWALNCPFTHGSTALI